MRHLSKLLAFVLAATPSAICLAAVDNPDRAGFRPGELIVKYRDSADSAAVTALRANHGLVSRLRLQRGRMELLGLPAVTDVRQAIALLRDNPAIEYAEPNFLRYKAAVTPNDTYFGQQWGLSNTGQPNFVSTGPAGTPGGDLNAVQLWDLDGNGVPDHTGRGTVTVAVVDDAIDTGHEDLAANMVAGYNFVNNNTDPTPASSTETHGTAVAGCVAAVGNNGIGVSGAAWNEKIMPLKFGYDVASEVRAFEYARDHGAKIVNASFGGPSYSQAEYDGINELNVAGIALVTSAGNENSNTDLAGASYPANYQLPNVIAVAATNRQDGIASFSSYGPVTVPVAAPGLQIVTTGVGNTYTTNGVSGTSFASPYVAGIAALILDYIPSASVSEIKARLIEGSVAGLNTAFPASDRSAGGRLDGARALSLSLQPSIVIAPVQTSSYQVDYGSSGGVVTVPVYSPALIDDGSNAALDPGETTTLRITLQNLWQAATNVRATLSTSDAGVIVNSGTLSLGSLAAQAKTTSGFSISVPSTVRGHQYVHFTLDITADGGYHTQRHFIEEIGSLQAGQPVTQTIQTDLYDEFHTWHIDVPSVPTGATALSFTTTASNNVDIIVRYAQPAQYEISLSADPADPSSFYFYNVPDAQVGKTDSGNETVTIRNPQRGTYFVTVVNYDQTDNASYTLQAAFNGSGSTSGGTTGGTTGSSTGGSSGGGGTLTPVTLMALLMLGLARGRRRQRL